MQRKKQTVAFFLFLLLLAAACAVSVALERGNGPGGENVVYFTEILASNSVYPAPDGKCRDYVELRNGSSGTIDLGGCGLTDDKNRVKYTFPAGTLLESGAYAVVWCESGSGSEDVANFSINRGGKETVYLLNRRHTVVAQADVLPLGKNVPQVLNASGAWEAGTEPTPGRANDESEPERIETAVRLSEIMTSNSRYPDENGAFFDWIELENVSGTVQDLSGRRLSDGGRVQYEFPEGTQLAAGERIVVYCRREDGPGFSLSTGETVILFTPGSGTFDSVTLPGMRKNESLARTESGWEVTDTPTPGYANTEEGRLAWAEEAEACPFVLGEIMLSNRSCRVGGGEYCDWIELRNTGTEEASLIGWYLSDDPAEPFKWSFPASDTAPGGYLTVLCGGTENASELCADFSLSAGETILLSAPNGAPAAELLLPETEPDRSVVCTVNGPEITDRPTPGFENSEQGYLALQQVLPAPEGLCISEAMSANRRWLRQSDGSFPDWVELYNAGSEPICLEGWYLTDSLTQPQKYALENVTLRSGEYYAAALPEDTLSLNAAEDWIYLCDGNGSAADRMHLYRIPAESSQGRLPGQGGSYYFAEPTPGAANGEGTRLVTEAPGASSSSGIYENTDVLTVELIGDGEIRYTTDGSVPTEESSLYVGPLTITETSVLRAVCRREGCAASGVSTFSYILNEGHTLPVVNLSVDPAGFRRIFELEPYSEREEKANLTFMEPDGSGFSADCGVRIYGSMSREFPKKSLKLLFRGVYGVSELNYDLYGGGVTAFDALVLRSGQDYPFSFFREELLTGLAEEASEALLTQRSRFCVLYVNGAYWGVYSLKEAFGTEWYANRQNVSEESCRIVRVVDVTTEAPDLFELMSWSNRTDLSDDESFALAAARVDTESLTDWIIFQSYSSNADIRNNIRYANSSEGDGKWRYCYYDQDWSMRTHDCVYGVLKNEKQYSMLPRAMLRNGSYADAFAERLCLLLRTTLSDAHVLERIDELQETLRPEMERERERWGGSVEDWERNVDLLRAWVTGPGRAGEMAREWLNYLGIPEARRTELLEGIA